ncbi:MAG: DUF1684 domain-containing protein [Bacteroidales bacterium]
MNKKSIVTSIILFCLCIFGYSQSLEVNSYQEEIDKFRKGKNIKLMYTESSPLDESQKKSFKGLIYFPANEAYRVEATLMKDDQPEDIIMKTSTDRTPMYVRYGELQFILNNKEYKLAAFQNKKMLDLSADTTRLFIPFRDETSGHETYGGGRYIDCQIPESGNIVIIDFNMAYNPYCAYNPKYSCVIPPEENRLSIKIEAGEKTFGEKH